METKTKAYRCRIQRMDGSGDSTIATYDPEVQESVTVAQDELAAFLDDCVKQHGETPPVWARRCGQATDSLDLFDPASDNLLDVDLVVIHQPLCGG